MSASFYDLMKYAKLGIASPEMTMYDRLKASALFGGTAPDKTITGIPPLTLTAKKEGAATSYKLTGKTVQNGTPTPDAPIDVNGVGDLVESGEHTGQYAIPITSNGATAATVYLGQTQTVRKIKKIIFDGQDNTVTLNVVDTNRIVVRKTTIAVDMQGYCSHLGNNVGGYNKFVITSNTIFLSFALQVIGGSTLADVNAYLAAQYAAGTPVTVWYVLAEPETAIVNEPLMKIGDYADELRSSEQAPPLMLSKGTNIIDVDTTVKPSEMSITGNIKAI